MPVCGRVPRRPVAEKEDVTGRIMGVEVRLCIALLVLVKYDE